MRFDKLNASGIKQHFLMFFELFLTALRNIHAPFEAKMLENAHRYCVMHLPIPL
jgi:hypothetical protein